VLAAGALAMLALLLAPLHGAAATPPPTPRPIPASEPWWVRVAFAGRAVGEVHASGGTITTLVPGLGQQQSSDGGRTWQPPAPGTNPPVPKTPRWRVADGRVEQRDAGGTWRADPGSPQMGGQPGLLAAPASLDGVVVAVDRDNVVWRRGGDGHWARALLLLPQDLASAPPRITAAVAFDTVPLSNTVYMGTEGYAVLISADGGDDWIRAGPGLPDSVNGLATDATDQAIYAATPDGLWVHHLRAFPAPPSYTDATLHWRWLGIALVTLLGSAAAVVGLLRVLQPR
jgi:hypothetical protein